MADRHVELAPFLRFTRAEWAGLGGETTPPPDLPGAVAGHEVAAIYLPLARLLRLHVAATRDLYGTTRAFLRFGAHEVPFVVGIAGGVAVGKSTTAEVLAALLSAWPDTPRVELVSTDGFLHPNRVLEARGLLDRKGFPETYDLHRLVRFLADVKAGAPEVRAPSYSHDAYDVREDHPQVVRRPDVLLVEGLNILEPSVRLPADAHVHFLSDYFDYAIYVHAHERDVRRWYLDRFMRLRAQARDDPSAYFHRFVPLSEHEATELAASVWDAVDHPNLVQNIEPTRFRARLILEKGPDHAIHTVRVRKL